MTSEHPVTKEALREWIVEALTVHQGRAELIEVCRFIWRYHEDELWDAGDLFYTWQYDVRWAATDLRGRGILKQKDDSPRGVWELTEVPERVTPPISDETAAQDEVRSPNWIREELILALELYLKRGNLNAKDQEVITLSKTLQRLPFHTERPANFRSPSSVNRKLGNFASLDPGFRGTGLSAASSMDQQVFGEFSDDRSKLAAEAERIRGLASPPT